MFGQILPEYCALYSHELFLHEWAPGVNVHAVKQTQSYPAHTCTRQPAYERLRWSVFTFHPSVTTYDLRLILRTRSFIWKHESPPYTVCISLRWINLLNILMLFPAHSYSTFVFLCVLSIFSLTFFVTLLRLNYTHESFRLVYCLPSLPISSFSLLRVRGKLNFLINAICWGIVKRSEARSGAEKVTSHCWLLVCCWDVFNKAESCWRFIVARRRWMNE